MPRKGWTSITVRDSTKRQLTLFNLGDSMDKKICDALVKAWKYDEACK